MKIYLIGMPGSGKSTIGRPLAESLNIPFFDLDDIIEKEEGLLVREIFTQKGEDFFRELERSCLHKISNDFSDFVLSTGGGTPCYFNNMEYMKQSGKIVFLDIQIADLAVRLQKEGLKKRPLLKDYNTLESLENYLATTLSKRKIYFLKSDIQVKVEDKSPLEIIHLISSEIKS